jgi:hypothetical protein
MSVFRKKQLSFHEACEHRSVDNKDNVIFQHPVALYSSDFGAFVPSMCNIVHYSFFVSFIGHYMND